jgi:hypothetical protein
MDTTGTELEMDTFEDGSSTAWEHPAELAWPSAADLSVFDSDGSEEEQEAATAAVATTAAVAVATTAAATAVAVRAVDSREVSEWMGEARTSRAAGRQLAASEAAAAPPPPPAPPPPLLLPPMRAPPPPPTAVPAARPAHWRWNGRQDGRDMSLPWDRAEYLLSLAQRLADSGAGGAASGGGGGSGRGGGEGVVVVDTLGRRHTDAAGILARLARPHYFTAADLTSALWGAVFADAGQRRAKGSDTCVPIQSSSG